jgi:hypothetical protein
MTCDFFIDEDIRYVVQRHVTPFHFGLRLSAFSNLTTIIVCNPTHSVADAFGFIWGDKSVGSRFCQSFLALSIISCLPFSTNTFLPFFLPYQPLARQFLEGRG